jgi:hypothetical protein
LPHRQRAQREHHLPHILPLRRLLLRRRFVEDRRRAVPQRHETAAVVVAGQVHDDRPEIGGSPFRILDAVLVGRQLDESLLHQVLGRGLVVDEPPRHPDQPGCLVAKEPHDQVVRQGNSLRTGDRRCIHSVHHLY